MPAAAAAAWAAPALVPGANGTPVVPSLQFSSSGIGLITAEIGSSETLGSVITGDRPAQLRPISPRLRLFDWSFYDDGNMVGVGYERQHGGGYAVKAAFGPAGGPLNRIVTVAGGLTVPTFAVDSNGRGTAAIVYTKNRGIYLSLWHSGRGFEKAVRMSGANHALASPAVKVDPRGDVLAAWTAGGPQPRCRCRGGKHTIQARIRNPSGHLSAIKRLGATGDPGEISLAFDKGRKALAGWVDDSFKGGIRLAYAPAGGRFRPTETVHGPEPFSDTAPLPSVRVAFSSGGHAQAAWASVRDREVVAAELSGGRVNAPFAVVSDVPSPIVDSLAAGPRGELVLSWTQGGPDAPEVFAAVAPGVVFGAPELVATGAAASQVAVDPVTDVPFAALDARTGLQYSTRTAVGS